MGSSGNIGLALFILALCLEGSMATSGCTNVLIGMSSCLNYVTGSSKTPSTLCCSAVANVVKSQPHCLCAALPFNINKTITLTLPSICDVKTPPLSGCNDGNNAPVMALVGSPESSMDESLSTFIEGSKSSETSDGGGDKMIHYAFIWGLLVVVALS